MEDFKTIADSITSTIPKIEKIVGTCSREQENTQEEIGIIQKDFYDQESGIQIIAHLENVRQSIEHAADLLVSVEGEINKIVLSLEK